MWGDMSDDELRAVLQRAKDEWARLDALQPEAERTHDVATLRHLVVEKGKLLTVRKAVARQLGYWPKEADDE